MGLEGSYLNNNKICFIALGAYPLFLNSVNERIIGPDVHSYLLAKEMCHSGVDVSFIVCDDSFPRKVIKEGINIHKIADICKNVALNKVFKSVQLIREMRRINADIYYQAGGIPAIVSLACKIFGKKFIYSIASDWQVFSTKENVILDRKYRNTVPFFSLLGNYLDIHLANSIIVQSLSQKHQLTENYKRHSTLIKMSFPLPADATPVKPHPPIIIWVGAFAPVKQPLLFVQLAQCFPEIQFFMIGGDSADIVLNESVKQHAKRVPNLKLLGAVPFSEIGFYYRNASLLINTSMYEGFPNSFVQAWMYYVPVLSLNANPDNILTRYNVGIVSGDYNRMISDLGRLLEDPILREKMGQNGRNYAEAEHDIHVNIKEYIDLLNR